MQVNKKSDSTKTKRDMEAAKHIRALRGPFTQAEFAKSLEVAQPMVSAWEAGRELPASADLWIKFGEFAGWPECYWFWERAGLDSRTILAAAQKTLNQQIKEGSSGLEGKMISILPFQKEKSGAKEPLLLQGFLLSNPLSTSNFTVDEESSGYGLELGDVLLIDVSHSDAPNLLPFWEERVLVEYKFNPTTTFTEYLVGGLFLREGRKHEGHVFYDTILQPWTDRIHDPDESRSGRREAGQYSPNARLTDPGPFLIGGWWDTRVGKGMSDDQRTRLRISSHASLDATPRHEDRARLESRLYPAYRIVGIVRGWIRPPAVKAIEKKKGCDNLTPCKGNPSGRVWAMAACCAHKRRQSFLG